MTTHNFALIGLVIGLKKVTMNMVILCEISDIFKPMAKN